MQRGKLIILSAPSGAGKTTILKQMLKAYPFLTFSVSATSRRKRKSEIHGQDYYFLSDKEFQQHIKNDDFLEYEEVYPGAFYGTLKSEVEKRLEAGESVIFDIDVKGGINIKKQYGAEALAIFIKPPSFKVLKRRLQTRGTEDEATIETRLQKAKWELELATAFDIVIVNDDLEKAVEKIDEAIKQFLCQQ